MSMTSVTRKRKRLDAGGDLGHFSRNETKSGSEVNSQLDRISCAALPPQVVFLFTTSIIVVTCIKFLLIPAYFSTDFEVHRNWMAITSQLPLNKWYTENTSQWTLDYPPFFAYFEFCLAYFAPYFDAKMLKISAQPYESSGTILYHRLTVIASDAVYCYAIYVWLTLLSSSGTGKSQNRSRQNSLLAAANNDQAIRSSSGDFASSNFIFIFLFLFNVGHLLVDHIHFQYNGLLNGLLLLSIARMAAGQIYWSAFWFATLLNFKHIYLYAAPAYATFLLVEHCVKREFGSRNQNYPRISIRFGVIARLAAIVCSIFAISLGPFIAGGQTAQLFRRLFPFERGLSHAYWAPNAWAIYNFADLIANKILVTFFGRRSSSSIITAGLVQRSSHAILPTITPAISLACVLSVISAISVIYAYKRLFSRANRFSINQPTLFIELTLISTLSFFSFGYHVHEKAILLVIPPLIPLIFTHRTHARVFLILSIVGYFSLFPLLHREAETPIKICLLALHAAYAFGAIGKHYRAEITNSSTSTSTSTFFRLPLLGPAESFYILGFVPLQAFYTTASLIVPRYEFLPLMAISIYCSIGVAYCFASLIRHLIGRLG